MRRITEPDNPSAPQVVWGGEARTAASLLLFAHLFAVVVAVTAFTRPSFLQQRLHELFDPYLRNLHLTAYPASYPFARYQLTHALPTDVDFSCRVEYPAADGQEQSITIPQSDLQPPIRRRRYQGLFNAAGTLAEDESNEDAAGILPKAIGGSILKQHQAKQGTIRLRAHYLPEIEDMADIQSGRRDPRANDRDVYEAQVFVTGARVDVLRKATTLEVAPVESAPTLPAAPRGRTTPQRTK
jgi:hypothetical protein